MLILCLGVFAWQKLQLKQLLQQHPCCGILANFLSCSLGETHSVSPAQFWEMPKTAASMLIFTNRIP